MVSKFPILPPLAFTRSTQNQEIKLNLTQNTVQLCDLHNVAVPYSNLPEGSQQSGFKLPTIDELFLNSGVSTVDTKADVSETQSMNPHLEMPIMAMLLKPALPLEQVLDQEREEKEEDKSDACQTRKWLQSSSSPQPNISKELSATDSILNPHEIFNLSQPRKYKIFYRFIHKFTLRFKKIGMVVTDDVTIEQFTKMLLARISKGPNRFNKTVYVQKQRGKRVETLDLVPLVGMNQLFLTQANFLQVRDKIKRVNVIEKPVLLKKRNKPSIGISQLYEKHSSPTKLTRKTRFHKESTVISE